MFPPSQASVKPMSIQLAPPNWHGSDDDDAGVAVCPGLAASVAVGSARAVWWAVQDSNLRPPVCKTDALPLS